MSCSRLESLPKRAPNNIAQAIKMHPHHEGRTVGDSLGRGRLEWRQFTTAIVIEIAFLGTHIDTHLRVDEQFEKPECRSLSAIERPCER